MRQALHLGGLAAANIGLAFVTQWYVVTQLGVGMQTDALFAGTTLPQLILSVISGSLVHVLVPLLAGEGKEQLRHDAWAFFTLVAGAFTLLAAALFVTAPWWTPWTVPGFDSAGQALTIELTRIQLVGMVFAAVNGVQVAAYHAQQRFTAPEVTPLVTGLLGLVAVAWLLPLYGVRAVAWITTVRLAVQTLLLFPAMGAPLWPDVKRPAIRSAWQRMTPLLLGTTYYKTDPLVDRFLLSAAASGSLSLYYLAQQFYTAATQVINKAIAAPLVPRLSRLYKAGDRAGFRHAYRRKLLQVSCLCLLALLVLGVAGEALLDLVIGYSRISNSDVTTLWWMMIWLAGYFIGSNAGQICASSFYALGDTATPTRISVFSYSVYIPCKVAAFHYFGVAGLAIATSLYYLANLFLQLWPLHKILSDELLAARGP